MAVTYAGPILIGNKAKEDYVGNLVNNSSFGAVSACQIIRDIDNNANTFYLPAGSLILRAYTYFTTSSADAAATVTWNIAGTAFTTAALGAGNRRVDLNLTALTPAQIGVITNIGASDVNISCTVATNSSVGAQQSTNIIEYLVLYQNGSLTRPFPNYG